MSEQNIMEKLVSLCKRRGFVFPGSEIYGGLANSWDYGPLGVELKNNIKQLWWKRFVQERDDVVGIDAALIMNPKIWEASGHLATFSDPLVECKNCHSRYRADVVIQKLQEKGEDVYYQAPGSAPAMSFGGSIAGAQKTKYNDFSKYKCPNCDTVGQFSEPRSFNLMFKTFIGPAEEATNIAYFRPETAQAMFVQFKNVLDTSRKKLPFGIAQIGKAFRNEITPGNFIFRTREFEQMEIEYFIPVPETDDDWQKHFEHWQKVMWQWMEHDLGLDTSKVHELEVPKEERAHYSKRTIDFEYDFPFGRKELYGLAYRTDFDLKNHQEVSGQNLEYNNQETGEKFLPHVIEPTWGVDRSVLAVLCNSFDDSDESRIVLRLPTKLAPYKAAVFPLLANKDQLVEKAQELYKSLRPQFMVAWDDRGNIGKRYASQDEIGTPFCITVDFQSLEDDTVTIRDRDTAKQDRIKIDEVTSFIASEV